MLFVGERTRFAPRAAERESPTRRLFAERRRAWWRTRPQLAALPGRRQTLGLLEADGRRMMCGRMSRETARFLQSILKPSVSGSARLLAKMDAAAQVFATGEARPCPPGTSTLCLQNAIRLRK